MYKFKDTVFANRLDEYNLENMADWCNGKVRGTSLPRQDQIVQFDDYNGTEQDAKIGDWIVKFGMKYPSYFALFDDEAFRDTFILSDSK